MAGGLEAVYLENRPALLRFLRSLGAGSSAEDVLQELWVRASSQSSTPIAEPLAYLYRAANNLMLDRVRSEVRRYRREQEWAGTGGPLAHSDHETLSGEQVIFARERLRLVEAALGGLSERTETIFRRFRIDGIGQSQIADELEISVSAVEKHLHKAYRVLLDLRRQSDAE